MTVMTPRSVTETWGQLQLEKLGIEDLRVEWLKWLVCMRGNALWLVCPELQSMLSKHLQLDPWKWYS